MAPLEDKVNTETSFGRYTNFRKFFRYSEILTSMFKKFIQFPDKNQWQLQIYSMMMGHDHINSAAAIGEALVFGSREEWRAVFQSEVIK